MQALIFQQPGSHARELNPFFKNGGTGLPEEEKKDHMVSGSSPLGLDAAWLRKALQRAEEQAKLEGKPLEEIAIQRWGVMIKKKILCFSQSCFKTLMFLL